jgi:hypothetical protein
MCGRYERREDRRPGQEGQQDRLHDSGAGGVWVPTDKGCVDGGDDDEGYKQGEVHGKSSDAR